MTHSRKRTWEAIWQSLLLHSRRLLADAVATAWSLFKIIIPVSIATRLLDQAGVVEWLGLGLSPVMALVGLPGSMGLVWATAMVTNIYGGMVVFATLAPQCDLTVAQVTVLGTMILVAHSLPPELAIARKAGARLRAMAVLRIGGALVIGVVPNGVYRAGRWLQTTNTALLPRGVFDRFLFRAGSNRRREFLT